MMKRTTTGKYSNLYQKTAWEGEKFTSLKQKNLKTAKFPWVSSADCFQWQHRQVTKKWDAAKRKNMAFPNCQFDCFLLEK